jgi:hypothetical protein
MVVIRERKMEMPDATRYSTSRGLGNPIAGIATLLFLDSN